MVWWSSAVVFALLSLNCVAAVITDSVEQSINKAADTDDYLVKQVIWKKCHRKLSPACLKLSLVRTVEMMSKDSSFFLAPGVFFSSNFSDSSSMPQDLARGLSQEHAHLDDLVSFAVSRFMRSVTLNVNLVDFFSGGNETVQNSMVDAISGRAKGGGLGGYGGIALVMGGSLASMMLAALAALAGKALMTSMLALMMSALAAMKGGGGGGGGEHKTYEVITKPIVSHVNTHSSEVQHEHGGHHHYGRSLDQGVVADVVEAEPYAVYAMERQRLMRSANLEDPQKVSREEEQRSTNPTEVGEGLRSESSEVHEAESQRKTRSSPNGDKGLTKKDTFQTTQPLLIDSPRKRRNVEQMSDQEKSSSEIHNAYSEVSEKHKININKRKDQSNSEFKSEMSQRDKRGIDEMIERADLTTKKNFHNPHQLERYESKWRNPAVVNENRNMKNFGSKIYFPDKSQEHHRHTRDVTSKVSLAEANLNYQKPPFKYIPNNPNPRIKRNVELSDPSHSRIYQIYQNPYEYVYNKLPLTDQFTIDNRRSKRHTEERLIMPLALVG